MPLYYKQKRNAILCAIGAVLFTYYYFKTFTPKEVERIPTSQTSLESKVKN